MPNYHVTLKACQAMASTVGGQRRILKRKLGVLDFIRKAVETGIYRTEEEIEKVRQERRESAEDLRYIMNRFRQDIVRGSHIHDYPIEYLIHEQHPPLPNPPRIPVKLLRQRAPPPDPLEELTKRYATKYSQDQYTGAPVTAEDYYRNLLGVQAATATRNAGVAQKPAVLQRAYAAAVEHEQLMRSNGMTHDQASQQVDEILQLNEQREAEVSRMRAQAAKKLRNQFVWSLEEMRVARKESEERGEPVQEGDDDGDPMTPLMKTTTDFTEDSVGKETEVAPPVPDKKEEPFLDDSLKSIFDANPAALEGMMRWSERLQAVPYKEWTIGAATALDHWIARRLLGLSEATWQSLLEGDMHDPKLMSKGRDIIAVRESLFPETAFNDSSEKHEDGTSATANESSNIKLDELFDDLISSGGSSKGSNSFDFLNLSPEPASTLDCSDEAVERLVEDLQAYRKKQHEEGPYEEWGEAEQTQFDSWLQNYVATMSRGNSNRKVDMEQTRKALLADPPVSKEEADSFWSSIQDEGKAVALLDSMVKEGPPPGATILEASFWDLPRAEQIERLLNLGALRPLLDEYTKESDRLRFLQRHSDTLMEGMKLEHLISDPEGPISSTDLPEHVRTALQVGDDEQFRLEHREYRSFGDVTALEKSRVLFKAWNEHKAGRARYEEKMFRTNRLGLRYDAETPGKKGKPRKR